VHSDDVDHALRCRVTATNVLGSKIAASAPVRSQAPPHNLLAPTIAGNPRVGNAITCTRGTWSGSTPLAYTYEWFRSGAPIAGAISRTYTVRATDAGHGLRCRVTVANRVGQARKASAAVRAR